MRADKERVIAPGRVPICIRTYKCLRVLVMSPTCAGQALLRWKRSAAHGLGDVHACMQPAAALQTH